MAIILVCDSVCPRAIKPKRLKLKSPRHVRHKVQNILKVRLKLHHPTWYRDSPSRVLAKQLILNQKVKGQSQGHGFKNIFQAIELSASVCSAPLQVSIVSLLVLGEIL